MQRPIKPAWLLRRADELGGRGSPAGQPRNVDLRRAASSAYHALFHHIVLSVADHVLPGASDQDRYAFGRHIQHTAIKHVCTWIATPGGSPIKVRDAARAMHGHGDVLDAALAFTSLYDARHDADYNHLADFSRAATLSLVDLAQDAIAKLDRAKGSPDLESFFAHIVLRTGLR